MSEKLLEPPEEAIQAAFEAHVTPLIPEVVASIFADLPTQAEESDLDQTITAATQAMFRDETYLNQQFPNHEERLKADLAEIHEIFSRT